MRVALMIEGQEGVSWDEWVALAHACEETGVEALFRSDHYGTIVREPWAAAHDAWATTCALAAVTSRVRLGTLVSPATFRHPAVLARTAVTADHVSGGRIEVGMGAGWYEAEHRAHGFPFDDVATRFGRFAEQVEIVVRSWTDERFSFHGRFYAIDDGQARPHPVQAPHPPLILGGGARPRSAALAARWATEYNTTFSSPESCREKRAALDAACRSDGRDPATLPLSLMTLTVVGADRSELRERLAAVLAIRGETRSADDALAERHDAWLVGTVDEVAARLAEYRAAGVSRVMLQHLDHRDLGMVRLIGERLAPAVAHL